MSASTENRDLYGLLAEFDTPADLVRAANAVRGKGYKKWDCYSPFPVHGLDSAMGLRDTKLPWIVLAAGLTGCGLAVLMQWWMNAVDYQLIISGKPLFSLPANIPIIFELTVLLSAFGAVFGMLAFNKLPELHHPLFNSDRFKRVTTDRFFIAIEASDPRFDLGRTRSFVDGLGGVNVELVEEG